MAIYRWLEAPGEAVSVDVLPCGDRGALLSVFGRRSEFAHIPVAFLADKDLWYFDGVPSGLVDIVFTTGYSIENDVLCGSCVCGLLSDDEREEFGVLADALAEWFAFEIEEYQSGREYQLNMHPTRLIPLGETAVRPEAIAPRAWRDPNPILVAAIRDKFHLSFRGHNLLNLYSRILNADRQGGRYSKRCILEMACKIAHTPCMDRIASSIHGRMTSQNAPTNLTPVSCRGSSSSARFAAG